MHAKAADFVYYVVSDLDNAIAFYEDDLGLPLESHLPDVGWAEFALSPTTLALWAPGDDEAAPEPGGGGATIALAVDDVDVAVADLRETDERALGVVRHRRLRAGDDRRPGREPLAPPPPQGRDGRTRRRLP